MSQRLYRAERLKSRKEIEKLFGPGGQTLAAYPLRLLYRPVDVCRGPHPLRVAFVVPKHRFRRAVDRNRLKRRIREAFRVQKDRLVMPTTPGVQYALIFIYTGKEDLPYTLIERKMEKLLRRFAAATA